MFVPETNTLVSSATTRNELVMLEKYKTELFRKKKDLDLDEDDLGGKK